MFIELKKQKKLEKEMTTEQANNSRRIKKNLVKTYEKTVREKRNLARSEATALIFKKENLTKMSLQKLTGEQRAEIEKQIEDHITKNYEDTTPEITRRKEELIAEIMKKLKESLEEVSESDVRIFTIGKDKELLNNLLNPHTLE